MIIYQMLFAFFYELGSGQWPAAFDADAHKGVIGVSLLEAVFALSISNIIEATAGYKVVFSHWWLWGFFLAVVGLNYYFLVSLELGLKFIPELAHYPRRKRTLLYGIAFGMVLIVGILFLYSVKVFHHAFLP
jgi:hypothetical protein